jgi:hypothetical protein
MFLTTIGIAALTHPLHTCLVCLVVARLVVEPFRAPNAAERRARSSARLHCGADHQQTRSPSKGFAIAGRTTVAALGLRAPFSARAE